jgi:hypothetical protein
VHSKITGEPGNRYRGPFGFPVILAARRTAGSNSYSGWLDGVSAVSHGGVWWQRSGAL